MGFGLPGMGGGGIPGMGGGGGGGGILGGRGGGGGSPLASGGLLGTGVGEGIGMNFSPHQIPIAGPLLFDNPNEEFQRQQMAAAAQSMQAMRPIQSASMMNAMRQGTAGYQGASNLLGGMYGAGAQPDYSQVLRDPMHPGAFDQPMMDPGTSYKDAGGGGAIGGGGGILGMIPGGGGGMPGLGGGGGIPGMGLLPFGLG
jgi:hypothetical protein